MKRAGKKGVRVKRATARARPATGMQRPRQKAIVVSRSKTLDNGAMEYRRMLLDPCGAPMHGPSYTGVGTGTYVRLRSTTVIGASDVAGIVCYQLGTATTWAFGSTNPGTAVSFSAATQAFPGAVISAENCEFRCLAGCVRIRYTGSEGNRSGLIGTLTGPALGRPSQGLSPPGAASTALSATPMVNRTGEVIHEVKFVPMTGDELFTPPGTVNPRFDANVITIVYSGVPPGSLQFEITAIYEYDPSAGQLKNCLPPATTNTTNQILASLGPVTNWAYSNLGAPVIKAAVGYAKTLVNPAVMQAVGRGLAYAATL